MEDNANLREEKRTKSPEHGSVEFIPDGNHLSYHFKLKDFSSKGLGILVRKDSKVLKHVKIGDVLSMKYHPEMASVTPKICQTEIKHISEPEPGQHEGHMLVGLMIME